MDLVQQRGEAQRCTAADEAAGAVREQQQNRGLRRAQQADGAVQARGAPARGEPDIHRGGGAERHRKRLQADGAQAGAAADEAGRHRGRRGGAREGGHVRTG